MRHGNPWEQPACSMFVNAPRTQPAWRYAVTLRQTGATWAEIARACGREKSNVRRIITRRMEAMGLRNAAGPEPDAATEPATGALVELQVVHDFLCRIDRTLVDAFNVYAATGARIKLARMRRRAKADATPR
jgi:hypothetical protein